MSASINVRPPWPKSPEDKAQEVHLRRLALPALDGLDLLAGTGATTHPISEPVPIPSVALQTLQPLWRSKSVDDVPPELRVLVFAEPAADQENVRLLDVGEFQWMARNAHRHAIEILNAGTCALAIRVEELAFRRDHAPVVLVHHDHVNETARLLQANLEDGTVTVVCTRGGEGERDVGLCDVVVP